MSWAWSVFFITRYTWAVSLVFICYFNKHEQPCILVGKWEFYQILLEALTSKKKEKEKKEKAKALSKSQGQDFRDFSTQGAY